MLRTNEPISNQLCLCLLSCCPVIKSSVVVINNTKTGSPLIIKSVAAVESIQSVAILGGVGSCSRSRFLFQNDLRESANFKSYHQGCHSTATKSLSRIISQCQFVGAASSGSIMGNSASLQKGARPQLVRVDQLF